MNTEQKQPRRRPYTRRQLILHLCAWVILIIPIYFIFVAAMYDAYITTATIAFFASPLLAATSIVLVTNKCQGLPKGDPLPRQTIAVYICAGILGGIAMNAVLLALMRGLE